MVGKVNYKLFKTPHIKSLFGVTSTFFNQYGQLPFDLDQPDTSQISEFIHKNKQFYAYYPTTDKDYTVLEKEFIDHANIILKHDMNKYNITWIREVSESWIKWQTFINGIQGVVDWIGKTEATPKNINNLVVKGQSMFLANTDIQIYEEPALDFWNPESHAQVEVKDLVKTGWSNFDKSINGGLERGTLSHIWGATNAGKSIFLGNIALNISLNGNNVFFASLEMASRKIIKRMGANVFDIDIGLYRDISRDSDEMGKKIDEYRESVLFDGVSVPPGHLHIQRFSEATSMEIFAAADKLGKSLGIKWGAIVIDYLGELSSSQGYSLNDMYALHKVNNSEIYSQAVRHDIAAVTAFQIKPECFGLEDYGLGAAAESRGITHRTDNIFGIIQPDWMKADRKYELKNIKSRDNEYKDYKIGYDIDYTKMRLTENGTFVPPNVSNVRFTSATT